MTRACLLQYKMRLVTALTPHLLFSFTLKFTTYHEIIYVQPPARCNGLLRLQKFCAHELARKISRRSEARGGINTTCVLLCWKIEIVKETNKNAIATSSTKRSTCSYLPSRGTTSSSRVHVMYM